MFLKNLLTNIKIGLYTFFASLKKVEENALTPNTVDNGDNGIHKEVHNQRVSKHLLKGEITQEVADLRYRDYTVASAAKKLRYTPDGRVVKIKDDSNASKFTVINRDIRLSILESISLSSEYTHTLKITYNVTPRFKLEHHCSAMDVDIDKQILKLRFLNCYNVYDKNKPFNNELTKICNNELSFHRHEFNEVTNVKFITFKVNGVDDYIQYTFNGLYGINIKKDSYNFVIT